MFEIWEWLLVFRISPKRLLLARSNNSKHVKLPNDLGMGPWNDRGMEPSKDRVAISLRPPIVIGISPDNWFLDKSKSIETPRFCMFERREPLNKFDKKFICKMYSRFWKDYGILNVSLLEPKWSCLGEVKLAKHHGICPESLLPYNINIFNPFN